MRMKMVVEKTDKAYRVRVDNSFEVIRMAYY